MLTLTVSSFPSARTSPNFQQAVVDDASREDRYQFRRFNAHLILPAQPALQLQPRQIMTQWWWRRLFL
jgi:hypothetical protein